MGRVDRPYERAAVAAARNALCVYAVLAALCGLVIWALWSSVAAQYGASGEDAALVSKVILGMYGGIAAAHLVLAIFVARASTVAWALAVGLDVLFLVWTLLELLESPGALRLIPISFNLWVVKRLLHPDVVAVFGRSRGRATRRPGSGGDPGPPDGPDGPLPVMPPGWPVAHQPPPAPVPPLPNPVPAAPARPAPSFDYFG